MIRRSLLAFAMLVLVGSGYWYFLRPPSEAEMIARFRANRAVFDQLVRMYVADNQDVWIGADGNYLVETASPRPEARYATPQPGYATPDIPDYIPAVNLPIARRIEYQELLKRAGVAGIGRNSTRNYRGPHRTVPFLLAYATDVPRLIYSSDLLDEYGGPQTTPYPTSYPTDVADTPVPVDESEYPQTILYPARDSAFDQTYCRRIEEHWYFCIYSEY